MTTYAADFCECPPCPGRGNDGHRMTHCAECCWGSGVVAELDCPTHGCALTYHARWGTDPSGYCGCADCEAPDE